ncbi:26S proteasome non-ATPase regulatory subunit 7 homolog A-like [Triticum urartu]|uniref:26S proteasome non-ATPase regulatory subunit 7 homolog A-like n=1 Tax=Triticum urartu TaxID=4572 RepID=UPI002042F3B2|nr:26S proteasome non-ATPase regulatory subunit 7 homolog A-like [Triticum urartu]XP_048539950.1 26S proteasome non-ATPase regulatory subunit 7 homolog A-like [Triticum urartu]
MDVVKAAQLSGRTLEKVMVHPLVLLSIIDHYNRVARDTRKRVVSVLLGTSSRGFIDVTNSYAVLFEEDDKDPRIWFLDHNYHESMFSMFKRINAKEQMLMLLPPSIRTQEKRAACLSVAKVASKTRA